MRVVDRPVSAPGSSDRPLVAVMDYDLGVHQDDRQVQQATNLRRTDELARRRIARAELLARSAKCPNAGVRLSWISARRASVSRFCRRAACISSEIPLPGRQNDCHESEIDTWSRANPRFEGMLDRDHPRHSVGDRDEFGFGVAAGDDDAELDGFVLLHPESATMASGVVLWDNHKPREFFNESRTRNHLNGGTRKRLFPTTANAVVDTSQKEGRP